MICHIENQIARHCNQPEAPERTLADMDVFDYLAIARKLVEVVEGDTALVWESAQETRIISYSTLKECIGRDIGFMRKLVTAALEGDTHDAQQLCIDKIENEGVDQIAEALDDYHAMPEGFELEDYL
jgi:hypothetical protein